MKVVEYLSFYVVSVKCSVDSKWHEINKSEEFYCKRTRYLTLTAVALICTRDPYVVIKL